MPDTVCVPSVDLYRYNKLFYAFLFYSLLHYSSFESIFILKGKDKKVIFKQINKTTRLCIIKKGQFVHVNSIRHFHLSEHLAAVGKKQDTVLIGV